MKVRMTFEERALAVAEYFITHKATVRETARHFRLSKSTVHNDLTQRILNREVKAKVQEVLQTNKNERHLRGGKATRIKYLELKLKEE